MSLLPTLLLCLAAQPAAADAGAPDDAGAPAPASAVPARAQPTPPSPPPSPPSSPSSATTSTHVVHRIPELVVTGSRGERPRKESTTAVEVIGRAEIEAAGAESVAGVLETHPGVELEPGLRGFTVRLQGLDPEYVLVLVDGERTLGRLGGALDLSRFPIDDVERIEIVKGAGSALYGSDAVAGVINIITRQARDPLDAGGHVSSGTRGTSDVAYRLGVRRARFDALVGFGHHRADAWDLSPETPETTGSALRGSNLRLGGTWKPGSRFRLSVKSDYLRREHNGVGGSATGALFDRRTLSEQASATLLPQWRFAGGSRLQLSAHYGLFADQFLSDQRDSDALDQFQKAREQLAKAAGQLDLALGPRHQLAMGGEALHERLRSPRIAGGRGQRNRFSVFLQHEWLVFEQPRLALQPGVRLDQDSQFGLHPSPKLSVRLDPHERLVLRASHGWGYRAPSFQELYIAFDNPGAGYLVAGNPLLEPERSRSVNIGAEWRPAIMPERRWLLSLALHRSDIADLIIARLVNPDEVGVPSRYSYANVARAHTQGLEAAVGGELVAGVRADVGYSFLLARDDEADRPLEGRARHRGTFQLGYRRAAAGFSAHLRGAVVGPRPFYSDDDGDGVVETRQADAHAMIGLRLSQVVWRKIEAFVGGENLLGAGNERYLPVPPRRLYAGLDFRYR